MSKPRITIRFEENTFEQIQELGNKEDRSINWIVNKLLKEALQKKKVEKNRESVQ